MPHYRSLIAALALAPLVASCFGGAYSPQQAAETEARLAQRLAGSVAGPPVRCLPNYRTHDLEVIAQDALLYRDGRTTYLQRTSGHCYPNGNHIGYALVTRSIGGNELCANDIAQVVHTSTGNVVGSCAFNEFVPYRRP